ncbi:MAG: IS30 family transposase [Clostridium sp.]|nr:IS30 family transposase [Clostridium sp.]
MRTDLSVRNTYDAYVGQRVQDERAHNKGKPLKIGNDMQYVRKVEELILDHKYSPYACTVYISRNCPEIPTRVCTVTLYNYIYSGLFLHVTKNNLPYRKKRRRKPQTNTRMALNHRDGLSIEERPEEILSRKSAGHWEMDTVVSGKKKSRECLLVLTERKTRMELVYRMLDKRAASTVSVLDRLESRIGTDRFRGLFRTITTDNGVEFLDSDGMSNSLSGRRRTVTYYCHPYKSCERGSNENQNRLIRRWIPKGSDISKYTDQQIRDIQDWINDYPRKMFGGKSAREVFEREFFNTS